MIIVTIVGINVERKKERKMKGVKALSQSK
jgi:hypothetical protein